jgi:uracil-DNA glycosylase
MTEALDHAGLTRADVLLWNVVPHCVSTANKNHNATTNDIKTSTPHTQAWIDALPHLRVVVFGGRKAQQAARHLRLPAGVLALKTFHTGAQSYNHERCRNHILATFQQAAIAAQPQMRNAA